MGTPSGGRLCNLLFFMYLHGAKHLGLLSQAERQEVILPSWAECPYPLYLQGRRKGRDVWSLWLAGDVGVGLSWRHLGLLSPQGPPLLPPCTGLQEAALALYLTGNQGPTLALPGDTQKGPEGQGAVHWFTLKCTDSSR